MRVRVPALLTAALTAAVVVTSTAVAVAAPAAATPVPSQSGDAFAMTAVTTPTSVTRPEGSRVLSAGHVAATTASGRDVAVTAQDVDAGYRNGIRFVAPIGKRFAPTGYDVARTADATRGAVTASWDGVTCAATSGSFQVAFIAYGPDRRVAAIAVSYTVSCANGSRFFGAVRVGVADASRLTVDTFATAPGVVDLGTVPIGATRRVTVTVTYHGGPTTGVFSSPAGPAAGDATLVANGCEQGAFVDGGQCLVIIDVRPGAVGRRTFTFGLGDRGGHVGVVYRAVTSAA